MQNDQMTLAQSYEAAAETMLSMEELTIRMIGSPEEALPALLNERQEMMQRVDALKAACEGREPADENEAQRVFLARQTVSAAACRIRELDGQLMGRLKIARERILEKIRSVGKSAGAKAARYYQPLAGGSAEKASVFTGSI